MKKKYLFWILILFCQIIISQNSDKVYLTRNHNFGTTYSYDVTEITIHSDSTYTRKNWSMINKKEWRDYKKYIPDMSVGKINRKGDYYQLIEYRGAVKTDFNWKVKITEKRLIYYYYNYRDKLKKGYKFKRIKNEN
jgi:hypothetical protein